MSILAEDKSSLAIVAMLSKVKRQSGSKLGNGFCHELFFPSCQARSKSWGDISL